VKPQFIWGYKDELPKVSQFKVNPVINVLDPEINLYELTSEQLNSLKFTWDEEGDDVWYRMLMVDDKPITNKYHGAILHFPFNDSPTDLGDDYMASSTGPAYHYGNGLITDSTVTRKIKTSTGSTITTDIQGFQGYGQKFAGDTADNFYSATGTSTWRSLINGLTRATFATHLVPYDNSAVATTNQFIWTIDGDDSEGMFLYIDANRKFNFTCSGVSLQSVNSFDFDGEKPYAVVLTFNADREFDNWKMFINGSREDTSATSWDKDDTIQINSIVEMNFGVSGASTTPLTDLYKGFIEEVVIYDKEYYIPPEENEYIFDTSFTMDSAVYSTIYAAGNDHTQTARLCIFDYHNIRGRSPKELATTSSISWKVTSV